MAACTNTQHGQKNAQSKSEQQFPGMSLLSRTEPRTLAKQMISRIGMNIAKQHKQKLRSTFSAVLPKTKQGRMKLTRHKEQLLKQPQIPCLNCLPMVLEEKQQQRRTTSQRSRTKNLQRQRNRVQQKCAPASETQHGLCTKRQRGSACSAFVVPSSGSEL